MAFSFSSGILSFKALANLSTESIQLSQSSSSVEWANFNQTNIITYLCLWFGSMAVCPRNTLFSFLSFSYFCFSLFFLSPVFSTQSLLHEYFPFSFSNSILLSSFKQFFLPFLSFLLLCFCFLISFFFLLIQGTTYTFSGIQFLRSLIAMQYLSAANRFHLRLAAVANQIYCCKIFPVKGAMYHSYIVMSYTWTGSKLF